MFFSLDPGRNMNLPSFLSWFLEQTDEVDYDHLDKYEDLMGIIENPEFFDSFFQILNNPESFFSNISVTNLLLHLYQFYFTRSDIIKISDLQIADHSKTFLNIIHSTEELFLDY